MQRNSREGSLIRVRLLYLAVAAVFGVTVYYFFPFTAEDAYIVYRYAENLVSSGALVFNLGEPINALTSPLHAVLSSVMYWLFSNTVLSNKIYSILLLLVSAALVWGRFDGQHDLQLFALSLIVLPPCILMWTVGGLETSLLLLLATCTALLATERLAVGGRRLYIAFFLAGLGFLARYDSVLFFGPLLLHLTLRQRSVRTASKALLLGALLPAAWLVISFFYYGDILPTSFYTKVVPHTPSLQDLAGNGLYVLLYLVYVGILPALLLNLALQPSGREVLRVLRQHLRETWGLCIALGLELLYGCLIATTHMMFGLRFFVPYIPAAVLLTLGLTKRLLESVEASPPSVAARDRGWRFGLVSRAVTGFLLFQLLFQGFQAVYVYRRSVNGLAPSGEYRSEGVRQYEVFMEILRSQAEDIRAHWDTAGPGRDRLPRIYTFAEGILPYTFRDTYIYGGLVSYRHQSPSIKGLELSADYIYILAPRHGKIAEQLPLPPANFTLISSRRAYFDGSDQSFLVFYNPNPDPNRLPPRIDDPLR